jgi:hypothetical protein
MNVNSKCVCVDAGYMNEHEVLFEVKSTCLTKMWKIFKKNYEILIYSAVYY